MKIISALERLPKATLKITITIPWSAVKKVYEKVLEKKVKEVEISGFRKGKAPLSLAKKQIAKEPLLKETLQEILPEIYTEAVKEHKLKPIVQPKIQIIVMDENKDWQLTATTCEKPKVSLKNYQEEIKNTLKAPKILVPGKEKKEEKISESEKTQKLFEVLLKATKIELPQILIEDETSRLLSSFLDQINKLGLTLDNYLNSVKKTAEQIRKEHQERAERVLKLEFILEAIADDLKIEVQEKEIDELIEKTIKTKEEKKKLKINKYYFASIIRRQKTLDKLLNL